MNKFSIDDFHIFTIHAGNAQHNGDWNWKNVRSPFARLYYVTDGEAQIIIHPTHNSSEAETINLRKDHLYFIPPFTLHSNVCTGKFNHYYIHLMESERGMFRYLSDVSFPREIKASDHDLHLFRKLCEINSFLALADSNPCSYDNDTSLTKNVELSNRRSICDKVESRGLLYILMSRFIRNATLANRIADQRIVRAAEYIKTNIGMSISVDHLAELASMSKDHFIRCFRKETGETPITYAIRRRVERAETLLVTTSLPIKSIAAQLGFDDSSYFYRIFKKYVGTSPLNYRENRF